MNTENGMVDSAELCDNNAGADAIDARPDDVDIVDWRVAEDKASENISDIMSDVHNAAKVIRESGLKGVWKALDALVKLDDQHHATAVEAATRRLREQE